MSYEPETTQTMTHRSVGVIQKRGNDYLVLSRGPRGNQPQDLDMEAEAGQVVVWEVHPNLKSATIVITPPQGFSTPNEVVLDRGNVRIYTSVAPSNVPPHPTRYPYSVEVDGKAATGPDDERTDKGPPTVIMPP